MKKLIVSLFTVATLGFVTTGIYANNATSDVLVSISEEEEEKKEVTAQDLPEAVNEGWAKSDYQDKKVEKIFKVKNAGVEYYEFIIATTTGKVAVHVDSKGKVLKEKAVL